MLMFCAWAGSTCTVYHVSFIPTTWGKCSAVHGAELAKRLVGSFCVFSSIVFSESQTNNNWCRFVIMHLKQYELIAASQPLRWNRCFHTGGRQSSSCRSHSVGKFMINECVRFLKRAEDLLTPALINNSTALQQTITSCTHHCSAMLDLLASSQLQ